MAIIHLLYSIGIFMLARKMLSLASPVLTDSATVNKHWIIENVENLRYLAAGFYAS
jgi:hypothetical protein